LSEKTVKKDLIRWSEKSGGKVIFEKVNLTLFTNNI